MRWLGVVVAIVCLSGGAARAQKVALGGRWMPQESFAGYAGAVVRVAGTDADEATSTYLHLLVDGGIGGGGAAVLLGRGLRADPMLIATSIGPRAFVEWGGDGSDRVYGGGQVRTLLAFVSLVCDFLTNGKEAIGRCGLDLGLN